MKAIEASGLVKNYGPKKALDGVDLEIEAGEIFALLGPNGAGKTTFVEILEGYRNADAGRVSVLGQDPARAGRVWRGRIGIVLQDSRDLSEATPRELISHFAKFYPNALGVGETIDLVGLNEKENARIRTLSGGQRRRLDVALGIIGRPEILFLDEPTTGFDPEARRRFWDLISLLKERGTTILLTTHYLDEAEHLADRLAVITNGKIVSRGTPRDIGGPLAHRPRVVWGKAGQEEKITTAEPTAVLRELLSRPEYAAGEIPNLQIIQPTLEEIYLELISND